MQAIYYTKQFTSGTLKGLRAICSARFETVEQCAKFAQLGKKGKDVLTRDRWTIADRSFQNYSRL